MIIDFIARKEDVRFAFQLLEVLTPPLHSQGNWLEIVCKGTFTAFRFSGGYLKERKISSVNSLNMRE